MKLTSLLFVCFLTELTQGLVSVSNVTAECNEPLTIHCNVSTWTDGFSVKHMEWSQNGESLCHVDGMGELIHSNDTKSHIRCEYNKGRLSLIFAKVQPEDSGASNRYMCKLRSNRGVSHGYSRIELQECCGMVKGILSKDGPVCTFSHVYPDGDVSWSSQRRQSEGPVRQSTFKSVEEGGWVTIRSQLEGNSDGDFNCTLMSMESGRRMECNLSEGAEFLNGYGLKVQGFAQKAGNAAGSREPLVTILLISILLVVMQLFA
ncbi:uncharacterized protein LOC119129954 [Syngnathus acus]|uniref:uncharacterized protein LOC119129954 n=1 Tax=Syngnathus acus TaxID=161584 RepID=UPI001885DD88|nr:uncharacterized protein LOC119129954 [Syngnathus acus]